MRTKTCKLCGREFQCNSTSAAIYCPECSPKAKAATVIRQRVCRQCGSTFPGGPRAWYCPACRIDRQAEASKKYHKNGAARPLGSMDNCEVCGKPYIVNSSRQRYCPECAPDTVKAVTNAQSRDWNAANATPEYRKELREKTKTPRLCVVCGKEYLPRYASFTCSPECDKEFTRRVQQAYGAAHRDEIRARHAERLRQRLAAMTPEELAAYREKTNAAARENYRKRKEKLKEKEL